MIVIGDAFPLVNSDGLPPSWPPIHSSGILDPLCPANPFVGQFTKTSILYCKFITDAEADNLIDDIYSVNNVTSWSPSWSNKLVFDNWSFSTDTSNFGIDKTFTKISTFIKLETSFPSWGGQPGPSEAAWTWIKLEITTHSRVGSKINRTESNFSDGLTNAINIDTSVIDKIQAELELPEGVVLAEITPVGQEVVVIAEDGEKTVAFSVAQMNSSTDDTWVSSYGECPAASDNDARLTITMGKGERSGTISSISRLSFNVPNCQITLRTRCKNIKFRFTEIYNNSGFTACSYAFVQVGTPTEAATGKMCSASDDSYLNQWTEIDGEDITIAHRSGWYWAQSGFTLQFQCVEKPTCDVVDTIFGEVNYVATSKIKYGSISQKNIITKTFHHTEADCANVRLSHLYQTRHDLVIHIRVFRELYFCDVIESD